MRRYKKVPCSYCKRNLVAYRKGKGRLCHCCYMKEYNRVTYASLVHKIPEENRLSRSPEVEELIQQNILKFQFRAERGLPLFDGRRGV